MVRSGKISELDIEIANLLLKLEKGYPSLQKISFHKAYGAENILAIIVGQGNLPHVLGYGGKIIRELQTKTGKKVRVIEKSGEMRKFLEDLFMPVPVTTINTIWLPDGSTETRVILPNRSRRLPTDIETLKKLVKDIKGLTLRVEFEGSRRIPLKISMRKRPSLR